MANVAPSPILSTAAKVYGVLLYLYPRAHRHTYGSLMAQLFRDLCRDVQQHGGALGLIRLWLDTLLDLAVTAVREHLQEGGTVMGSILETHGLALALTDYANKLAGEKRFRVHVEIEGNIPRLHKEAESLVFGIVQEAAANAKKHAQADNLWIRAQCQENTLDVSVRDDGQGFDMGAVREAGETDISKRAKAVQAKFSVQSAVGEGTSIQIAVPLAPNLASDTA